MITPSACAKLTLAVLEDNDTVMAQLKTACEPLGHIQWVYETALGGQMKDWLDTHRVDILIVDLGLPDMSGLEVIRYCREHRPETQMLVCTLFEDETHVFDSLMLGASGYLLKHDIANQFVQAIEQLRSGGAPMSPSIARRVLVKLQTNANPLGTSKPGISPLLDDRQLDILRFISRGYKYLEISQLLNTSIHTVHGQIRKIYTALEVNSKNAAVYEARLLHLID